MRDRHRFVAVPVPALGVLPPVASGFVVGLTAALACLMLGAGAILAFAAYALVGAAGVFGSALLGAHSAPRPRPVHMVPHAGLRDAGAVR